MHSQLIPLCFFPSLSSRAVDVVHPLTCSATFLGAYRLVPPFLPPDGCPAIPACAQHSRLKEGCHRCEEVTRLATAAVESVVPNAAAREAAASEVEGRGASKKTLSTLSTRGEEEPRVLLGLPIPPVKFYTRARVRATRTSLFLTRLEDPRIFFLIITFIFLLNFVVGVFF